MDGLRQCFFRKSVKRPSQTHDEVSNPMSRWQRGHNADASNDVSTISIELSSVLYSRQSQDESYPTSLICTTPSSVSQFSSINRTRDDDVQRWRRARPANSTFIKQSQTCCVRSLEFSKEVNFSRCALDRSTRRPALTTSSSERPSRCLVSASMAQKTLPSSDDVGDGGEEYDDSAICDCRPLGRRPECIGEETCARQVVGDRAEIGRSRRKSERRERSFLSTAASGPVGSTLTKSKRSCKASKMRAKELKKQLRYLSESAQCSLHTLALL